MMIRLSGIRTLDIQDMDSAFTQPPLTLPDIGGLRWSPPWTNSEQNLSRPAMSAKVTADSRRI